VAEIYLVTESIFSSPLSTELCMILFSYLEPEDLLNICQLNKNWHHFCKVSAQYNEIWWKLCMQDWYDDSVENKNNIPKSMTRKDKQKNWKETFLRVTVKKPKIMTTNRPEDRRHNHEFWDEEGEEKSPSDFKKSMRLFYKSIRSKPKGKKSFEITPVQQRSEWDHLTEGWH